MLSSYSIITQITAHVFKFIIWYYVRRLLTEISVRHMQPVNVNLPTDRWIQYIQESCYLRTDRWIQYVQKSC